MSRQLSSFKRNSNPGDFSYNNRKKSRSGPFQSRDVSVPNHHRNTRLNARVVYSVVNEVDVNSHIRFTFWKKDNKEKDLRGLVCRQIIHWVMKQTEYAGHSKLQEVFEEKWPVVIHWPQIDMEYVYNRVQHIVMQWVNQDLCKRRYCSGKHSKWEFSRKFYSALGNGTPGVIGNNIDLNQAKKLSLKAEVAVQVDCHESQAESSEIHSEEKSPGIDCLKLLMNRVSNSSTEVPISTEKKDELSTSKASCKVVMKNSSPALTLRQYSGSDSVKIDYAKNVASADPCDGWGSSQKIEIKDSERWGQDSGQNSGWNCKKPPSKKKDEDNFWLKKKKENSLEPSEGALDLKSHDPTSMHDLSLLRMEFNNAEMCIQEMEPDKFYYPAPMLEYYDICKVIGATVYTDAMRKDTDIFEIKDKRSTQRAIQFSVFMTREKLSSYYESEKTVYLNNLVEGSPINPQFLEKGDISKRNHWTDSITDNQMIYWLSAIVSQSGWDLGFKDPELTIECIFNNKFRGFLTQIGIMPYIGDCSLCFQKSKKRKVGWKKEHMYQHFIQNKGWLHDMLGFYCHHRYDNIDAIQFANQKPFRNKSFTHGRSPLELFCIKRSVDIRPTHDYAFVRTKF